MTERRAAGPTEATRRLYARIWEADDGTWWQSLQPGAHGFGIMPWIVGDPNMGRNLYGYLQTGTVPARAHLHPSDIGIAFVQWSRRDDLDLLLRLDNVGCYQRDFAEPILAVDHSFNSVVFNAKVAYEATMFNSQAEIWVPTWAVTPIDEHYFWAWLEEADERWFCTRQSTADECRDDMYALLETEELGDWLCCGDEPMHRGECCPTNYLLNGWTMCQAILTAPCPHGDHEDSCDDCCENDEVFFCYHGVRFMGLDEKACDCGLTEARDGLFSYTQSMVDSNHADWSGSRLLDVITYDADVYAATLQYAFDAYFRGWKRCAELAQSEEAFADTGEYDPDNLEHNWFSLCWQQLAPFLDYSGPERQVAIQLPLSTSSAMQQAC